MLKQLFTSFSTAQITQIKERKIHFDKISNIKHYLLNLIDSVVVVIIFYALLNFYHQGYIACNLFFLVFSISLLCILYL